ncbi:MAG TPA: XRE family transcriptional regulator [Streptosporangiaceae bacterium]
MADVSVPTEAAGDPADGIGRRLAALRGDRRVRVTDLAREVGVSPSLISQIERGQSRPSVSTLFALSQALGVPVDAFFREDAPEAPGGPDGPDRPEGPGVPDAAAAPAGQAESRYVVRRGDRASIDIEGGVRWERLTPATLRDLDFLELVYGPHAESNPTLYTHPGVEMVLMMTGTLEIHVGFERYRLKAGDSMHFPSSMPHRYVNPAGTTSRAVTVIVHDGAGAVDTGRPPPRP